MDYEIFKMKLMDLLQKKIGRETKVNIESIPKNNGILLDGLVFHNCKRNITPIIYIEDFYEYWKQGISMELLVDKILKSCEECVKRISVEECFFQDYEQMKPHIYYKLVNYEKNKELLMNAPHRKVLDLAMIFYYRMENIDPMVTIVIQNAHMEMWNITEEELERNACKYTYLYMPAVFMTMAQVMEMDEDEWKVVGGETAFPMYILTNQNRQFGAGAMLYPGILSQAEALLGENFYILPSSIHECILVPRQGLYTHEELTRMVTEINDKHLDAREILSNQAYLYEKQKGRIKCFY